MDQNPETPTNLELDVNKSPNPNIELEAEVEERLEQSPKPSSIQNIEPDIDEPLNENLDENLDAPTNSEQDQLIVTNVEEDADIEKDLEIQEEVFKSASNKLEEPEVQESESLETIDPIPQTSEPNLAVETNDPLNIEIAISQDSTLTDQPPDVSRIEPVHAMDTDEDPLNVAANESQMRLVFGKSKIYFY